MISEQRPRVQTRDLRLGRVLRTLRRRAGLGQVDLARKVGVSHSTMSRLERGYCEGVTVATIRRAFGALGASVSVTPYFQGATMDRLLDEDHALLAGRFSQTLRKYGWSVETEVSYSRYGERGSIDLLAYHTPTATVLVVEIKTALGSSRRPFASWTPSNDWCLPSRSSAPARAHDPWAGCSSLRAARPPIARSSGSAPFSTSHSLRERAKRGGGLSHRAARSRRCGCCPPPVAGDAREVATIADMAGMRATRNWLGP
jgi:transcriptional regulator with XRE-family HTH domain